MKKISRNGSALVGVIWMLAVLSILIASYTVDAHLQTRINLYLRERVTVDHLTDAGLAIAEVILTDYQSVSDPGDSQTVYDDMIEDDRWYEEKLTLKKMGEVSTGAIPVDALNPEAGTVSVTIRPIESKLNINNLYAGGDANFGEIWMRILAVSGIPKDYWDGIVNGWCDWRDSDGAETGDEGAESEFYAKAYEEFKRDAEYNEEEKTKHKNRNYRPKSRDGEVVDLEELKAIKGFNEYEENPINADAILNGGVLNPSDDEKEWITVTNGICGFFSLYGSGKINVNAVKDPLVLAVIPGIFQGNPDDEREEDIEEAKAIAQKIIEPKTLGFADKPTAEQSYEKMKTGVMEEVKKMFRPEFINRIDEILVFHSLSDDEMNRICSLLCEDLIRRADKQLGIKLKVTPALRKHIVAEYSDPKMGARPLKRAIQKVIEDALSEKLLAEEILPGQTVTAGYRGGNVVFDGRD